METKRSRGCSNCGCPQTKKNGRREIRELDVGGERRRQIQRYRCLGCGRSFTGRRDPPRRFSQRLRKEVVRRHIEGRESYRVIARWVRMFSGRRVSSSLLQRMVEDLAGRYY